MAAQLPQREPYTVQPLEEVLTQEVPREWGAQLQCRNVSLLLYKHLQLSLSSNKPEETGNIQNLLPRSAQASMHRYHTASVIFAEPSFSQYPRVTLSGRDGPV